MALPLELVLIASRALNIDPSSPSQAHLLTVAKAYLELPLPTFYKRVIDENGNLYFLDRRTSQAHPDHPQLAQLQQLVSHLSSNPPAGWQCQTSMLISRDDGTTYTGIHDFVPDELKATVTATSGMISVPPDESTPAQASPESNIHNLSESTDQQPEGQGALTAATEESNPPFSVDNSPLQDPSSSVPESSGPSAYPKTSVSASDRAHAAGNSADGTAMSKSIMRSGPQLVQDLPRDLLESLGLLPPETSLKKAPRLRFYSWWYEDAECPDLTLRVSGDSSAGGGVKRRYLTLEYDVPSKAFTLRR